MTFWQARRVCVTGGAGFIGSHAVEQLVQAGADVTVADSLARGSLARLAGVEGSFRFVEADVSTTTGADEATRGQEIVLNLAAKVAGIEYNNAHNADMFSSNVRITTSMLDAAARNSVGRVLVVSSACVYPGDAVVPTPESEGMRDSPEPANEGYGWAKRMAEQLGRLHAREGAFEVAICRPFNAYGPRDHWDERTSHVIPALIRRISHGEDPIVVWGSGKQTRAFLHARDVARGMLLVTEKGATATPINIGHDVDVSIHDLVFTMLKMTGRSPDVVFDTSRPDGDPRRAADSQLLRSVTGWVPDTPLETGLAEMIEEYESRSALAE